MASIITADTGAVSGTAGLKQSADSSGVLALATGTGTTAVTIDANQNFMVGKTSFGDTTAGAQIGGSGATYPGRIVATVANSTSVTEGLVVYSSTAGAYRFYVSMDGKVNATNTTIAAISDQRLKENIRDLDDGLSCVMALQPRKFDWKEGKGADIKNVRGFIAQEFEQVFPDLIDTWKDPAPEGEEPYKSVRADLTPTLVKAIQEQQALITTLTERISALEAK
jgi:Chaperone of endosialidase